MQLPHWQGKSVLTGGLDALEFIGKKTMKLSLQKVTQVLSGPRHLWRELFLYLRWDYVLLWICSFSQ